MKRVNKRGRSKCSFLGFLLRFFLALLRWLHLATQRRRKKKNKKRWVSISVVLFVLFVLHMFLLVGLGYCPFLDPIMYDA